MSSSTYYTCGETSHKTRPRTVYLALFLQENNPYGEFNWGIVLTLGEARTCILYKAETQEGMRAITYPPGAWDPLTSKSLLCLIEIIQCSTMHGVDNAYHGIHTNGETIIANQTITPERQTQVFTNRTFALDVLARSIPAVSGQASITLESCVVKSGDITRNWIADFMNPHVLTIRGIFKIFKFRRHVSQSDRGPYISYGPSYM